MEEKNQTNDRDILLVSLFTFLTVFVWIFFALVKTIKTTTVSATIQQTITPLSSAIDTTILDQLATRTVY